MNRFELDKPEFEYTGDLVMLNVFGLISDVLTPKTGAFFEFMSKTVMSFDMAFGRVYFTPDHKTKYVTNTFISREILIYTRVPIVDSLNTDDLGWVLVNFENEELMGLEFLSPTYVASAFEGFPFHTYVVDLVKKTYKHKKSG